VKHLLENAAGILETARNAMLAGHEPTDMVILTGVDGGVRMFANSEWSLGALQREYGAAAGYRISAQSNRVQVDARSARSAVRLESESPARAARMLLGATVVRQMNHYVAAPPTLLLSEAEG